jgi:hypothetical protein
MYSPAFRTVLIDARVEDLRAARGTSVQPDGGRGARNPRATARWGLLSRVGIWRLAFAASGPRS